MSDALFVHELLLNDEDGHDKIWGWGSFCNPVAFDDPVFVFYGKREGRTLTFKQHVRNYALKDLERSKRNKGYKHVNTARIYEWQPNFNQQVEDKLPMVVLSGNKYKGVD